MTAAGALRRLEAEVLRLHETLCFLRAYPDDRELLDLVERMLDCFERRTDLRRHRRALVQVIRAKGGLRDSVFVRLFDAHPRLGRTVLRAL